MLNTFGVCLPWGHYIDWKHHPRFHHPYAPELCFASVTKKQTLITQIPSIRLFETVQKCSCFTSSSTDWNSLSSTARSIKTVPWLVQWKVRYGLAPAALQITRFKSNKNILMQAGAAELMFYEIDTHPAVLPEASQCLWWVYDGVRKRWCRSPWAPRDPCQPTRPEWSNGKRTHRYKHEKTLH